MKKENKKTKKVNKNGGRNKFLSLLIVVVCFAIAFVILIKAQQQDTYNNKMKGDNFSIQPEYGKVLVAKDNSAIYPKYYVAYFNEDEYSIYVYNYYETVSQYELELNRLLDSVVDYNSNDKMIRYLHSRGYGSYQSVVDNLTYIVDCEDLLIY